MATLLPPNQFEFAASDAAAEQVAAPLLSQAPSGAAADLSDSGATDCAPDEAAAAHRQTVHAAADICDIGEIFAGARKLDYVPGIFEIDPTAITTSDQLLYDVLKAMVDPRVPGLRKIPDEHALFDAIEPPPLFLQAVGY